MVQEIKVNVYSYRAEGSHKSMHLSNSLVEEYQISGDSLHRFRCYLILSLGAMETDSLLKIVYPKSSAISCNHVRSNTGIGDK